MSTYTYGRDIAESIERVETIKRCVDGVKQIMREIQEDALLNQARSDRRYFYGEDISGIMRITSDGLNVSVTREPRSIFDRRVKNASGQWEYC